MKDFWTKADWRFLILTLGLTFMVKDTTPVTFMGVMVTSFAISWDWKKK